ncbi:MAG TPA: hypothetical protein VEL71_01525 [Candidatus Dormibacteraeota bacterium]|nr:hypothetical protein [Candidatus Dormibacteraeota bacterium]
MPEVWRDNLRTSRVRDGVSRLLTSLQAMWLLDLRERPDETRNERKPDGRVKKVSRSYHKGLSRQAR